MSNAASRLRVAGPVAAFIAVICIAGCGGSNNSGGGSNLPSPSPTKSSGNLVVGDVCMLVTAADASTAAGTTVTQSTTGTAIPGVCFYASADRSAGVLVFAQALPDSTTASHINPDQIANSLGGQYGISNSRPVEGIGDKALEYTATGTSGSSGIAIFVFKANVVLFIIVAPSTDSSKVETLAKTAVGRLHS